MLNSVEELPPQLQRPYQEFWTDEWNLCCFIAFLDGQPGILLAAEYDDDYCVKKGIPTAYESQRPVLYGYGERLEKLAHEINPYVIVGLSYGSDHDPQLMLFIPTEMVLFEDVPKLYYLMDQYGFQKAPESIRWTAQELAGFIQGLRLSSASEQKMLDSLNGDEELCVPGKHDDCFSYMGQEIDRDGLYSRDEVVKLLDLQGATDHTLDQVQSAYMEQFGCQLIWKYPFSDDMQGGGTIVPVQEGFLFLPYKAVFENSGARYQLKHSELLTAEAVHTLMKECRDYTVDLLFSLREMEDAIGKQPAKHYMDEQGNLYFVRAGIGDVYKGFRRLAEPKQGQRRESGIRCLRYVKDFGQAQLELDLYAKKHSLRQVDACESRKET